MSSFSDKYIATVRRLLPQPFTIAILLTILTMLLAFFLTEQQGEKASRHGLSRFLEIADFWQAGLWTKGLLAFTVQMMLILVLGHVLALTKPVNKLIDSVLVWCTSTANAAFLVTFLTLIMAYFNWGLGLIFGAIFARKVAEYSQRKGFQLNYPLIGAAGYSGLMVWHGGLSASAPLTVSQPDHFLSEAMGVISTSETIFSGMNLTVALTMILVLPLSMYLIGKSSKPTMISLKLENKEEDAQISQNTEQIGAEKLDHSLLFSSIIGGFILLMCIYIAFIKPERISLEFLNLNFVNLFLLGAGILLHGSFSRFIQSTEKAIAGATGILIQFPLYFGIMGIVQQSGLIDLFSNFMIGISHTIPFEINTFISAAVVNVFVPSGGGQWAVQGPIIADAASDFGVSYSKSVMALAYGDQLTNMLQPFWALPLLGITGLKAKEILPYTLFLMLIGFIVYASALLIF